MNILIIMPWIRQGGAEVVAVETAHQLQKCGHSVLIVALFVDTCSMNRRAKQVKYFTHNPWLSKRFKINKFLTYFLGPFFLFWLTLRKVLWADILFPHSLPAYWIAAIIGNIFGKKIIWLCHEPPYKRKLGEVPIWDFLMWQVADSFMDKLFVRGIDQVIVYSKIIQREVKSRYRKKAKMIRLGIDFDFFAQNDSKRTKLLKQKYQLQNKFIMLAVGKLGYQKNQILAIDVLLKILPIQPNSILVLVGEGPDKVILKAKIKNLKLQNKVIFTGFIPPINVRAWYQICDLVLYPSIKQSAQSNQSWGLIPFEALCKEKISIVSSDSGAAEVLRREHIGIVAKPDINNFLTAINDFLNNQKKYHKQAEKGYLYVKDNLTWKNWGRKIEELIVKVKKV